VTGVQTCALPICAGVRRFVFASSNAPLGEQPPPAHEGLVPRPLSPYGASKLAGEAYGSAFHGAFGLLTVSLRFANAYGPRSRRKGSVVAAYCRAALEGRPLVIYGDGAQTRDFIHVRDLCQAIRRSLAVDAGGEVFQVATGTETTILDLAGRIRALAAADLGREVAVEHRPARAGEILRNTSDIAKARRVLGFAPAVALADGLPETWRWFREHGRCAPGGGAA
jgi:UDP-glucose 4-epimerase